MEGAIDLEKLRYPVGKFRWPKVYNDEIISNWIEVLERFPTQVEEAIHNLDDSTLDWRYRPDGWNIRQVVHHCADSHMNAFIRIKLALTEDEPTILPYMEAEWSKSTDTNELHPRVSIQILKGLHHRWTYFLKKLSEEELNREYGHPDHSRKLTIKATIAIYEWHCRHHLAHIHQALEYKGRFN